MPGAIEVGDILIATKGDIGNSFVAYQFPRINSQQYEILSGQELGVVTKLDVADTNGQDDKFIEFRMPQSPQIRYAIFDLAYLKSEANPEYNYPEAKKTRNFDFAGIFTGIGAIITSVGGVLTSNKPNLDGTGGYEYDPITGTYRNNNPDVAVETSWFKRNFLYIILGGLVAGVGYIFYRDKKKSTIQSNIRPLTKK